MITVQTGSQPQVNLGVVVVHNAQAARRGCYEPWHWRRCTHTPESEGPE